MRPPVRADAAMRCSVPYDRDSLAGAAISACRIQSRHKRLCARGSGGEAVRFCRDGAAFVRARRYGSVEGSLSSIMPLFAILAGCFALDSRPALCFFLGIRPVMQFWRSTLPSKCGCPYKPVTVFCPRFAPGLAILLPRFDFGLCPCWRYVAALPSVRARPCNSVIAF